jgi:hypothetical protein
MTIISRVSERSQQFTDSQCPAKYSAYQYFLFAEEPWADQGEREGERERERERQTHRTTS